MGQWLLRIAAGAGSAAHVYFAYIETCTWNRDVIKQIAPSWFPAGTIVTNETIAWAQPLAFNTGIYNLMLAFGLAWTTIADAAVARSLGIFFAIWLLVAAAAAMHTDVTRAFLAQGALGLLLLLASIGSPGGPDLERRPKAIDCGKRHREGRNGEVRAG